MGHRRKDKGSPDIDTHNPSAGTDTRTERARRGRGRSKASQYHDKYGFWVHSFSKAAGTQVHGGSLSTWLAGGFILAKAAKLTSPFVVWSARSTCQAIQGC